MKTLTGIWTMEIAGVYGWENRGILIFAADNKHVMGGGRNHYSVGRFRKSGRDIKIKLELNFYAQHQVFFGTKEKHVSVVLEGRRHGGKIKGEIRNPKNSKQSIPMRLTRQADLPEKTGKK